MQCIKYLYLFILVFISYNLNANTGVINTETWSYSNYSKGSYVPKTGVFTENAYSHQSLGNIYETEVKFKFDSYNVQKILEYNTSYNQNCSNKNAFVTLDISALAKDEDEEKLNAFLISSNLPNAKRDLESDYGTHNYNEESEVVVLDPINSWKNYEMTTFWEDYRTGNINDGGNINVQFGMSIEGFSDYNTCLISSTVQVISPYGNSAGSL